MKSEIIFCSYSHGHGGVGNSPAISALGLLAFLFFLNLIQVSSGLIPSFLLVCRISIRWNKFCVELLNHESMDAQ
jgi:hypothetical protein